MAKTLVLAEKPSVARELARVLGCKQSGEGYLEGEKYIVTWALGHLVELAPPEDYDKAWAKWDMLTLPMLPERMKTVVIPQSGRQFRAVQAQLRRGDVGELVIATDAGREGELVARWILEKAGWKGPTKRLWISSQTDRAIREGFAHLRPAAEYDNLFYSARARSEADWLVGLNVTRALTCKYNAQLSAGRVQTPTLALIVDREEAIRSFRPREFDTLQIRLEGFTATWRDGQGQARIFDREKARALAGRLAGKEAVIRSLQRKRREVPPPALWDFDVIASNPPYIPSWEIEGLDPSVRDYEPRLALDGGADGLDFYRLIARNWKSALRLGGTLLFEVGMGQDTQVAAILAQEGYQDICTYPDTQGIQRVVGGVVPLLDESGLLD